MRAMYDHDAILAELQRQLRARVVIGRRVAARLGIPPPRVSEMLHGVRRIQPHEMAPLVEMLGMDDKPEGLAGVWQKIPACRRDQALRTLESFIASPGC